MNESNLEQAVKSLKSLRIGMTDAARHHLALQCSEATPSRLRALLSPLAGTSPFRLPAMAGAMAIFLACGLALLLVGHQNHGSPGSYAGADVHLVKVLPASSGGVTLEWKDGPQRTYTVLRSTDPRNIQRAESYAVRGNRWTDDSPSPGQVVYYKVE